MLQKTVLVYISYNIFYLTMFNWFHEVCLKLLHCILVNVVLRVFNIDNFTVGLPDSCGSFNFPFYDKF